MNAKELRIGDMVMFLGKPVIVECLMSDSAFVSGFENYTPGWTDYSDMDAIPLTKKILEKNGYEQGLGIDECSYSYSKDDLYLEYHWDEDKIYFQDFYRSVNYKELQYVHELQHILWALGMDDKLKNIEI